MSMGYCLPVDKPLTNGPLVNGGGSSGCRKPLRALVGLPGLEPGTFGPPDRRANQAAPQPVDVVCAGRTMVLAGLWQFRGAARPIRRLETPGSRGRWRARRA